jgi:hypothetical protein
LTSFTEYIKYSARKDNSPFFPFSVVSFPLSYRKDYMSLVEKQAVAAAVRLADFHWHVYASREGVRFQPGIVNLHEHPARSSMLLYFVCQ